MYSSTELALGPVISERVKCARRGAALGALRSRKGETFPHLTFLIKAVYCKLSMHIIGKMDVNAMRLPAPPLSLSMIQRHDLWALADFWDHPSRSRFTMGLQVVNHTEGLSVTAVNPFPSRDLQPLPPPAPP